MNTGNNEELGLIIQSIRHLHKDIDWNVFEIERKDLGLGILVGSEKREIWEM